MIKKIVQVMTSFSIDHPRRTIGITLAVTLLFAWQFPRIMVDTDPKHMLPLTSPVRQYNDQVERDFALHPDVIALGIVNKRGIANKQTLSRIVELTRRIKQMPGVISRDVTSLSTIDNITSQTGELLVKPALDRVPESARELAAFRQALLENPLFINRIISPDGTATAIYVPIEQAANGKEIADQINKLLPQAFDDDQYYLAGDPVARDTFGTEMFRQMGLFSPLAGMVMALALWLMFHSLPLIAANMAVAMVSIIWCMGLLIGLGYPVHIMSSMSPVFLMAIATDSVHIFNEFAFRFSEVKDKRRAVLETMAVVADPVFYSDVTTAVGFAALATASIVPVKIFGLCVGFGTLVILLMSFTLVPAIMMLLREERIPRITHQTENGQKSRLADLGEFCIQHAKAIAIVGGLALLIALIGLSRIRVNNNMVHWFKSQSAVRTADRVMNAQLGGTSSGYLVVQGGREDIIKDPAMLRGIEGLQWELEKDPRVGKTFSVVDYVKRINRVLHDDNPAYDRIPDSVEAVGQYLFLFCMSAKPSDLDNVVDYPFRKANIFLQLKSWDAEVMAEVIRRTENYLAAYPLPDGAVVKPAGIAYFNLIWSNEVLWGMLESFLWGLVLVLILLVIQTRSLWWGLLTFLPLLFTIALIYGVVGLIGKDFDMPVAVLSTLSLGLAIDFAIHFVGRFHLHYAETSNLKESLIWTVTRPGKGIFLNGVLFALGFAVMIFADLTPYITVGVLMAAIMLLSALMSVIYLPGLIHLFQGILGLRRKG
ncbi:MAG: MMPL family transporter [Candidatus Schekmanbacteria bacterium]|nr:MMPL family transporter [Candidatus Schekmanbacteria bacterium]